MILTLLLLATQGAVATIAERPAALPIIVQAPPEPGARYWNQTQGNPMGSAAVDVAPVMSEPKELWREEVGVILGAPVVWGETIYVATRKGRSSYLHAHSLDDGKLISKIPIGSGTGSVHLGAWQGSVVVVQPELIKTYELKAQKTLRSVKKETGVFGGPPCVARGYAFITGRSGELHCVDMAKGKLIAQGKAGRGRPSMFGDTLATVDVRSQPGFQGDYFTLVLTPVLWPDKKSVGFGPPSHTYSGMVQSGVPRDGLGYTVALALGHGNHVWYGRSPVPLKATDNGTLPGALFTGSGKLSHIKTAPTVLDGVLYGFSDDGAFVRQEEDGRSGVIVNSLPKGAVPAPATRARGVAYFGNWAVDLKSRRVLWRLPKVTPAGPMLPVGDDKVAYWTKNELVCLSGSPVEASTLPPSRPGTGEAVILDDGTRLPGSVVEDDESVRVTLESGVERTFKAAQISLVESADTYKLIGEEYPVLLAWLDALNAEVAETYVHCFDGYLKVRALEECSHMISEARARGLSRERLKALNAKLVGKKRSTADNAEQQLRKKKEEEEEALLESANEFLVASEWCHDQGFEGAATVLLREAHKVSPKVEGLEELAEELIPADFPWRDKPDSAELWMDWAEEILPAGAEFVNREDPEWVSLAGTIWKDDTTIALKTPNLLVFCKSHDSKVVGPCLRNGEAAVRTLEELFPRSSEPRKLFEVRIHADKEAYHEEKTPSGTYAMPWSAGYYSPRDRISRFYVPLEGENQKTQSRKLHRVFAHELTHQYLAEAWLPSSRKIGSGGGPDDPGYWATEGVARFVEDQVLEMGQRGQRGQRFNDPTVRSVDATAQLYKAEELFPLSDFVDMTYKEFVQLDSDPGDKVDLESTLVTIRPSQISMFYEQAGTLVFFLMNRRDLEGRKAFEKYLRSHYEQRSKPQGWETLGFESAEELQREFDVFLSELE